MLVLLSLIWGGSFFFNEVALTELPVLTIVASRVGLASIVLWVAVFASGIRIPRLSRAWLWFFVICVLNNIVPYTLIVWGQTEVTGSLAAILNATTPFFTVIVVALFVRDEPISRNKIVGVLIAFSGVVVMMGPEAISGLGRNLAAQLAVLLAALSYAFAGLYGRRFHAAGISPLLAAAGQSTMASLVLLPAALLFDGPPQLSELKTAVWMSVISLAVLSTAVAYILYFRILNSAGAINVMLVTFLMPVSAILLGVAILKESVRPIEIIGMGIITIALVIIDGRLLQRKPPTTERA